MKLFAEQPSVCRVITESAHTDENHEPEYFLEGIFMQAEIKNRNGRVYPLDIMKREVERYDREYVQTARAFGELEHPSGGNTPSINLDRVSHIITKIWQEGNYFKARAKILDTPCGRIVKAMIKEGCQLGVSSRALGSVTMKNGTNYVGDDFHLITAGDIVFEPSAQAAFPVGIINEDVEWELDPATGEYVQAAPVLTETSETVVPPAGADCAPATPIVDYEAQWKQLLIELEAARHVIDQKDAIITDLRNQLSTIRQLREFDNLINNIG